LLERVGRTSPPGSAGLSTYDDAWLFNGAMDRYDWKLVGKKEMYIPYNGYRLYNAKNPADVTKAGHVISVEEPQLVIDAILEVVERARKFRQDAGRGDEAGRYHCRSRNCSS
jgi:hypothetical protein